MQSTRGIAMADILREVHPFIFRMGLPAKVRPRGAVRAVASVCTSWCVH
jgi:hypothetical protein